MMPHISNSYRLFSIFIATLSLLSSVQQGGAQDDPGSPLFLTPLIKGGEAVAARDAALVKEVFNENVISYSGFITINETQNSNLFFWFFPSEETYGESFYDNDVPIILWSDGGPGASLMLTLFNNYGPFNGNQTDGSFTLNPDSWHKKYHMIFLDNPVDVGFSFTDHEDGFVYSSDQAAVGIYEFLTQFFTMFPYLQNNKFYNAGASYGGTYAVEIATLIHQHNLNNPEVHINLQGLITDSPYFESYSQSDYGDVLFNAGLINSNSLKLFHEMEQRMRDLIDEGKFEEGELLWQQLILSGIELTGYAALYQMQNEHQMYENMTDLIVKNSTRRALHVGSQKFEYTSLIVQDRFLPNMMRSVKSKLDNLFKQDYRVLLYVGNMDVITGHLGIQKILQGLSWEHASELIDGSRYVWKDDKGVAGYVTTTASNSSAFVVLRNAGHGVCIDQPERCFRMLTKFVDGNNNW